MKETIILGSGMAGFGAAHRCRELGVPAVIYDKKDHHGGHTASHSLQGFTFDEGPHISYTGDERIKKLLAESAGGEIFESKCYVNNYWKGQWIRHPAQVNLHGLPTDLVVKILQEFIAGQNAPEPVVRNYDDWLYAAFGPTFADTFPKTYTRKYHTTDAAKLSTDWLGPRIYRPKLDEVLRGAVTNDTANVHYITEFRYPKRNGFVSFLTQFARDSVLRLSHELTGVDPVARALSFKNGHVAKYDHLVSSLPLPELIPMIKGVPKDVVAATQKLTCSEVVLVTLGVDRPDLTEAHWTYIYDEDITTVRLSTPHMQSPNNAPPGHSSIQAEIYFSKKYKPLTRKPEEFIDVVIGDLRRIGLFRASDNVVFRHAMHVPYANVIFDLDRAEALKTVHGYLDDLGIAYCGRYGEWAYIWTDQSFISGENAAQKAIDRGAK